MLQFNVCQGPYSERATVKKGVQSDIYLSIILFHYSQLFVGITIGFSNGPALVILSMYFVEKRGIATSLGDSGSSF